MSDLHPDLSRRGFLATGTTLAATTVGLAANTVAQADDPPAARPLPTPKNPLRIAVVGSIYRFRSHAYHIVGRFLHGYRKDGVVVKPPIRVARMFMDQFPADDLARRDCAKYGIELCDSVETALGGPKSLDVDGVLHIVEHGDYPKNARKQILYPRFELFERITNVFRASGRSVPVFVDKHFSYDAEKAHRMFALSRELKFPLLAGSSLPVTYRSPELELPRETPLWRGLATMGYDRDVPEIYLFHALETLQVMMERRTGGETGVKSVRCVSGEAVWKGADEGWWSWDALQAALERCPTNNVGPVRDNVTNPLAIFVEYNDGTRGAVLNLIEQSSDLAFAGDIAGQTRPAACCMLLPGPPRARFFDPLSHHIAELLMTGLPNYPAERTLLTTCICDFAHRSLEQGGAPLSSPLLDVRYPAPPSSGFFRGGIADAD